jgi:hypothetical protein
MFLSAGQTSDYIGARAWLLTIPQAGALLADRGYDADWFRHALIKLGISPCIPSKLSRTVHIPHDAALYRLRSQDREHVPATQGLAQGRDALRSMPDPVSLCMRHRRYRHLLVMSLDCKL